MRFIATVSLSLAAAATPALSQATLSPARQLAELARQDAGLRQRIGQIQLDALVSKVDRTFAHKDRGAIRASDGAALQREIDLYTF